MVAWAAVLFGQSSLPGQDIPEFIPTVGWDKLIHLLLYGILAWLAMRARVNGRPAVWIILLFCVVYGASDEFHQMFVPGRTSSIWDLLADTLGAALSAALFLALAKRRAKRATFEQTTGSGPSNEGARHG